MKNFVFRRPVSCSAAACMSLWLLAALAFLGFVQLSGNFHPVIAGELYRSAQPTAAALESYVRAHGIKTIINLRGANDRDWWNEETETARRLGVEHIDFRMSATKLVSAEQADALVAIMKSAPKPILLHCLSGADRTGIASAIYARQIAGMDAGIAERQLSFYYGHIAIPYLSAAYAMDESWETLSKHFGSSADQAAKDGMSNALVAIAADNDGLDRRRVEP